MSRVVSRLPLTHDASKPLQMDVRPQFPPLQEVYVGQWQAAYAPYAVTSTSNTPAAVTMFFDILMNISFLVFMVMV